MKTEAKEKVCIFSSCTFCHVDNFEPLHLVMSDDMGKTLIQIKQKKHQICMMKVMLVRWKSTTTGDVYVQLSAVWILRFSPVPH